MSNTDVLSGATGFITEGRNEQVALILKHTHQTERSFVWRAKARTERYLNSKHCPSSSSSSSSSDNEKGTRGEETPQKITNQTPPQPMKPPLCPIKGEKTGHQRAIAKKQRRDEKKKELSPKKGEPLEHNCQKQPPVHASVHAEDPTTKLQVNHDTSLVLTDIDVAVGVGTQCYSLMSHPGNVALNDGILQALPAVSQIRGKEKTQ